MENEDHNAIIVESAKLKECCSGCEATEDANTVESAAARP